MTVDPLPGSPDIPPELTSTYADWTWDVAYQYGPPMLTYRVTNAAGDVHYVKLARHGLHPSLGDEAKRMRWAVNHLPVPHVVQHASNDDVGWLITRALPGTDAMDDALRADPERLVRILAAGLRMFHLAPVDGCPFDFRLEPALEHARRRLHEGRINRDEDFHPEFAHLTPTAAVRHLERARPRSEDLVVCHGDYCLPNVLIERGGVTGFVDLGELGVADRWWDLGVATWSVTWNLGPGYEDLFLEAYGVERDDERTAYYRLLYEVVS